MSVVSIGRNPPPNSRVDIRFSCCQKERPSLSVVSIGRNLPPNTRVDIRLTAYQKSCSTFLWSLVLQSQTNLSRKIQMMMVMTTAPMLNQENRSSSVHRTHIYKLIRTPSEEGIMGNPNLIIYGYEHKFVSKPRIKELDMFWYGQIIHCSFGLS